MPNKNKNLRRADKQKNDEFYTLLPDIERELVHYKDHFKNKVVLCNCDDPQTSNFFYYFAYNFEKLGLKKLITTSYSNRYSTEAVYSEYNGDKNGDYIPNESEITVKPLKGNGDFRSDECIEFLKQADIVVTNPPFSLFREYVAQLIEYDKKFAIVGNLNAITYKEIFKFIKENKLWLGYGFSNGGSGYFKVLDNYPLGVAKHKIDEQGNKLIRVWGLRWYTNLDINKRHEDLILYKKYSPAEFPKYDNYNAINVDKVKDIPCDYAHAIGVPISLLDKYNPEQFEILGITHNADTSKEVESLRTDTNNRHGGLIDGKKKYMRILIKNKRI